MAGMNNLDYLIVGLIALGGLYGLGRGALRMATSVLSVLLGLLAALTWSSGLAVVLRQYGHLSTAVSSLVGYIVVFVAIAGLVEFAGRRIVGLAYAINLSWIDRIAGMLCGAALNAAFAGIFVGILSGTLPSDAELIRNSMLAPRLRAYNQTLAGYLPKRVTDFYDQKRGELLRYWNAPKESPAPTPSDGRSGT